MRTNVQGHMPDRAWSKANVQRMGEISGGMQGKKYCWTMSVYQEKIRVISHDQWIHDTNVDNGYGAGTCEKN